jgi:uncharacterized membrane protein
MESGIALALIVLAVAVATASFVSTTTAVGLVSVVIAGTATVGFVSNTKELSCRPGWFRLPVQYSSILFCMTIFAMFNVVAADGSSPNKNHGSSHIAAVASAVCLVAAASIRPRRTVPVHNYGDYDDDDDDGDLHGSNKRPSKRKSANPDNDDDNVKMNTTKSLRSRGKKRWSTRRWTTRRRTTTKMDQKTSRS